MKLMNSINSNNYNAVKKVMFYFFACLFMILSSCKEDNDDRGFFSIKDNPSIVQVVAAGSSETYTVEASGKWKVEPLRKENWVKVDPMEGEGNGTFTVTVNKNTEQEQRLQTLFFTVDGKLQNTVLKIEQAAATESEQNNDSYLRIDGFTNNRLEVLEEGVESNYILRSTGKWKIALEEDSDWINVSPMEGEGDVPITITVAVNRDVERTANLILFLNDVQQTNPLTIYQKGVKLQVEGDIVLSEDFSWLSYGNEIFNATSGETRIALWTESELAKGWTSTINPTPSGGNYASIYARPGFIKLGRTNYGGDLISPKLLNVQRTKNLLVTFKAVRYAANDYHILNVGVKGPGTVSVNQFNVMNIPVTNSNLESCRAAWQAPEATYSFVVNGATAETQVWFLGGDFDQRAGNWPATVNRIFIDDIVITVTE